MTESDRQELVEKVKGLGNEVWYDEYMGWICPICDEAHIFKRAAEDCMLSDLELAEDDVLLRLSLNRK